MCSLLIIDGMSCVYLLGLFGLKYYKFNIFLLIFFLDDLSTVESGILKISSLTILQSKLSEKGMLKAKTG